MRCVSCDRAVCDCFSQMVFVPARIGVSLYKAADIVKSARSILTLELDAMNDYVLKSMVKKRRRKKRKRRKASSPRTQGTAVTIVASSQQMKRTEDVWNDGESSTSVERSVMLLEKHKEAENECELTSRRQHKGRIMSMKRRALSSSCNKISTILRRSEDSILLS